MIQRCAEEMSHCTDGLSPSCGAHCGTRLKLAWCKSVRSNCNSSAALPSVNCRRIWASRSCVCVGAVDYWASFRLMSLSMSLAPEQSSKVNRESVCVGSAATGWEVTSITGHSGSLGSYSASRKGAALTFSLTSANITPDSESVCFVIILTKFVIQCQCTISLRHSREWVCGISGNGSRVRQCLNTPFYECQPSRGIYTVSQKNKTPNCCP